MPQVGPQLPPHLVKRKRSIDDNTDANSPSPPTKIRATSRDVEPQPRRVMGPSRPPQGYNEEAIALSDGDNELPGPSQHSGPMPPPEAKPAHAIGPAPPLSSAAKNEDEISLDDSDDDIGPSLPSTSVSQSVPAPRRVLGPAPPPAALSERPPASHTTVDDDSSSDDDYGPSLPPAPGSAAALEASAHRSRELLRTAAAATAEPAKPKRADWMLVPPSDSDWTSRVDPTKLKNRKFASGKGAKAPTEKSGVSAIWTETPEEKRRRLEDEVLGRKELAASGKTERRVGGKDDEEQEAIARRIREYNDKNRGKSLLEEHSGRNGGGKEKEDDPSKRGFDKEKDMGLGGRISHVQKRDMLNRAGDFGQRFERGKFL